LWYVPGLFEGRYFEYTLCALYSEENIEGLVLNFKDVTMERQLREKVIQKDKREALGNLVAGIAHEIRTPLTSIKTFIELLPVKFDNPHFREKISMYVPQEIERVNNMVNNLLNYAKPRKPAIESVSILSLIKITMISLENLIERKNIKVILNAMEDITVYADKQQVQQVLINVLLNAVEALSGVKNPEISISCMESGHEGIIVIEDNGPGIDQSSIKKVFDPFYTTKPSGTGLGLAISSQIIRENGGNILIDSKLESGAKVSICLPMTKELECNVNE
jgi:polar amino acid transport system substrate-binding protein